MSRIVQIRRGNAEDNNNFTGAIGELTMDTDAKTIRVHDGETLGGFALARADQATGGNDVPGGFDITSVPDEFWADTVEKHTPCPFTIMESANIAINPNAAGVVYNFDTDLRPVVVDTMLVCQVPQAGYTIGDEVMAFGIGNHWHPCPNVWQNENGIYVQLFSAKQDFWVANKTDGNVTNITPENWVIKFRVYGCKC